MIELACRLSLYYSGCGGEEVVTELVVVGPQQPVYELE